MRVPTFANCSPLSRYYQFPGQKSCPDREQWFKSVTKCKFDSSVLNFGYFSVGRKICLTVHVYSNSVRKKWCSRGVMVKLLVCGARGPGFNSCSRYYNFRDWLSPAFKSIMAERLLKRHKS